MVKHLLVLLLLALTLLTCKGAPKHPVVLVPGLGASKLWNKKDSENCYSGLWINPSRTFFHRHSVLEDLTLAVNPTTGAATDESGSTVKACGFGDTTLLTNIITPWDPPSVCEENKGICEDGYVDAILVNAIKDGKIIPEILRFLCKYLPCPAELKTLLNDWRDLRYYEYIINSLVGKGYKANEDIKGAPYDFRKAPDDQKEYYSNLKKLVEDLYHDNNNVPVVMIAHSMGNPVLLNFYNKHTTKEWKDKYIHAHIALAPPWAGSVKPVKLMVSGDNEHIPTVHDSEVRPMQRSWPGVAWLMPSPSHDLWEPEVPLVVTPNRNYSVNDYKQLFDDLDYHTGYLMWKRTQEVATNVGKLPELRALHVLYGDNMPTPCQYVYPAGTFPDSDPQVKNGKGDGTVNKRSLEAFKKFESSQSINLTHQAYDGVDHLAILSDRHVLKFITDLVLNYEESSGNNLSQDREKEEL